MAVMHEIKFKSEKISNKSKKNKIKMEVENRINKTRQNFPQRQNTEKNCYFCGAGKPMLNNCEIRDMISRYQWFDRKIDVHIHHRKAAHKDNEKQWKETQM